MKKITLMIVLCLLAGSGFAFNPCVPWVHDEITESAAKQLGGFSDDVIKKLKSAVRAVDYGESKKKVLPPFHQPNDDYDPAHHFDRPPSIAIVTHKDAFIKGAEYLRSQKQKAINDAKAGKTDDALATLGRALHALQDFKAHSNYIDLTPAEQKQARDALMDENKNSPANLKLTGFNRNAENPGRPVGDPYPHDDYCKDSHRYPESKKDGVGGINKCKLAKGSATSESVDLLKMVRDALTADEWKEITVSYVHPDPNDEEEYAWVKSEPCGANGCLVSNNGIAVQFPHGIFDQTETVSVLGVPDNFFMTPERVRALDGGQMIIYWEIRPKDIDFEEPAFATVDLLHLELLDLLSDSPAVYYADPVSHEWLRVPGASVDILSGLATFDVTTGGTYAIGGTGIPSAVKPQGKRATTFGAVKRTILLQNYPNPFNPETWLPYQLSQDTEVTIHIYSVRGQLIRILALGHQSAGSYFGKDRAAYWNGRNATGEVVSSGTYFCHFRAGGYSAMKKIILTK